MASEVKAQVTAEEAQTPSAHVEVQVVRRDPWRLAGALAGSLLYSAMFSAASVFGAEDLAQWFFLMGCWAVYWVVLAVLTCRWWVQGRSKYWRPFWSYQVIGATIMMWPVLMPLLLIPRYRNWLKRVARPFEPGEVGDPEAKRRSADAVTGTITSELTELARLRESGHLTNDEFGAAKKRLLHSQ